VRRLKGGDFCSFFVSFMGGKEKKRGRGRFTSSLEALQERGGLLLGRRGRRVKGGGKVHLIRAATVSSKKASREHPLWPTAAGESTR